MSYLTYSPATSKYPIRGFSNPNFTRSPDAAIVGFKYWKIVFDQNLSEIQMDLGGGALRIFSENGIESTTLPAALVDGIIPAANTGFANGSTYYVTGVEPLPIIDFWISPQTNGASGPIYNPCKTFTVSHSEDNVNWSTVGFGTKEISISTIGSTVNSPYTGTILRPAVLVKVGFS
jgi:hypothetical protein